MKNTGLSVSLFVFLASVFGGVLHADALSTLAGALSGTVLAIHFYRRLWREEKGCSR